MENIDVSRCKTLWLAVIERARKDLKAGDKSAQVFLDSTFFDTVCDMAGLDAQWAKANFTKTAKPKKAKKQRAVPLSSPAQLKAMARWRAAHPDYMRNYKQKRRQSC